MVPVDEYDMSNPLDLKIYKCLVTKSFAGLDALIIMKSNSIATISESKFTDNKSLGRGSVFFADQVGSKIIVANSEISKNKAKLGGVGYVHFDSIISIKDSIVSDNLAIKGGVIYINDEGSVKFENSTFENNYAVQGNVVY